MTLKITLSILAAFFTFSSLAAAPRPHATSAQIKAAIDQFPFVQELIQQTRVVQTTSNSCDWNWECWEPVEHCLEGKCVDADPFNQCYSDLDCWPNTCESGKCVDR